MAVNIVTPVQLDVAAPAGLPEGTVVVADLEVGVVYPLTACCGASAKGAADGVVCRGCYRSLPDAMGMGWTLAEAADMLRCNDCGDLANWCPDSPLRGQAD